MQFLLIFIVIYLVSVIYLNEVELDDLNWNEIIEGKEIFSEDLRVLVLYPHPDDEVMMIGGTISKLINTKGVQVKVISTTHGEKGDELVNLLPAELAQLRAQEFENAMRTLGVEGYEIWDLPDGELKQHGQALEDRLIEEFGGYRPNIVFTYERAGLYGHSDHIQLTKSINKIVDEQFSDIQVLYTTLARNLLKFAKLPTHMADGEVVQQRAEYKLPIWRNLFIKYKAAKQYKSQNLSHGGPLLFKMLFMPYEYITTKR